MKALKDLTPEECIKIASIVEPDVEWKFIRSVIKWDGFDLVEKDNLDPLKAKHIFQIDYSSDKKLKNKPRFRIYDEHLFEYGVGPKMALILSYLQSI